MYLQITLWNCIMQCQLHNVITYWIANCNIYAPIVALCLSDGDCIKFCCRSTLEMASAVVPPSISLKTKESLLQCVGFVYITRRINDLAMGSNIFFYNTHKETPAPSQQGHKIQPVLISIIIFIAYPSHLPMLNKTHPSASFSWTY